MTNLRPVSQACSCGRPLGFAAVIDRPGAVSYGVVTPAGVVEVCAQCHQIDGAADRDVKPENATPPKRGRR